LLLDLAGDPERDRWIDQAREHAERAAGRRGPAEDGTRV
jgi:predicted flap endonuclease-1-like 5' DNA nuclease